MAMTDKRNMRTLSRRRALGAALSSAALAACPAAVAAPDTDADADLNRVFAQWSLLNERYRVVAGKLAHAIGRAESLAPPAPIELLFCDRRGRERVINEVQIEAIQQAVAATAGKERGEE